MQTYDHKEIEKKWQEKWEEDGLYKVEDDAEGENEFVLTEFPYPSGNLHVGHWYAFSVPDIYARFRKMQGVNVLFPVGFDAFGLPAENAAIKNKVNPREWTYKNMDDMRSQMRSMGTMFDWSREVVTCDPAYYKWTQWLFLQLYKAGLVYRKEVPVNWCPADKTVLANEQVVNGECERCGAQVEQREMLQWNMKITDYADRLLEDLEELDWPEAIKESQRNWIGKSEGAEIEFPIKDSDEKIKVFTTRPDTLFGATYMVLAPEHALVEKLADAISNSDDVRAYVTAAGKQTEIERLAEGREKTGVKLEGISVINPANQEEIPVFIADYVLAHYGTGAIMAVPSHDTRDYAFATKYDLALKQVVVSDYLGTCTKKWLAENDVEMTDDVVHMLNKSVAEGESSYSGEGKLINSEQFDGMESLEAKRAITEHVGGTMTATYKLRDWTVSRQRYWGVPIPMIICGTCGEVPVPEDQLPVELPDVEDYLPSDYGKSPLAKVENWVKKACPSCGGDAQLETDTFDTFVDSSWYYIRYADAHNENEFAAKDEQSQWLPVDLYSGGAEHTTMHVLYSRFWHKALFDLGLVADKEPYTRRMNRGIILGPDGNKMSKSKGNVIDPDDVVGTLGADTVRTYLAFIGPFNEVGHYPWSPDGIVGIRRFLERMWRIEFASETSEETERQLHKTIKKVTDDVGRLKFNTAIASMMECINVAEKHGITEEQYGTLLQLLAPFAPHLSEELWHEKLSKESSIHTQQWPQYDSEKTIDTTLTIAIQINGKVRDTIEVSSESTEDEVTQRALSTDVAIKWLDGGEPKNVICIPGRLVNIVI